MAEARAVTGLSENDGPWRLEPHDPAADRRALEKLAEHSERYSPTVGIESGDRPEGLLLDITGVARLFGGEAPLAKAIAHDLTRWGLVVRLGLADTIGAAWAAARYGAATAPGNSPSAAGTIADIRSLPDDLGPLPIEALRLSADIVNRLHQLGIDRIAQLEALPRADLSSRFTPQLLRRMDQAAGRLAEAIPGHRAAPKFQVEWSPEYPTTRRSTIAAAIEKLIRALCEKLASHGRGAVQVECRLLCPPHPPVRMEVGMFEPSTRWRHVFGLVELRLERLRLPGPVAAVLVSAPATAALVYEQRELFSDEGVDLCAGRNPTTPLPSSGRQRRTLAGLVDRLSSRLGPRAVLGVRLLADAQPELAWRGEPLVERLTRRTARRHRELPPRPLRLRRRPIALAATSIGPGHVGDRGCLVQFSLRGRQHRIARCWGPERIETGWWRGRAVGRDYYRVETTQGTHCWLFRRLRDGKWFLQGLFE